MHSSLYNANQRRLKFIIDETDLQDGRAWLAFKLEAKFCGDSYSSVLTGEHVRTRFSRDLQPW